MAADDARFDRLTYSPRQFEAARNHPAHDVALVGAEVDRVGLALPARGTIVYADYCTSEVFFGRPNSGAPSGYSAVRWETAGGAAILVPSNPIGFGEDAVGNLYVAGQGGQVYRFVSPAGNENLFANGFEP